MIRLIHFTFVRNEAHCIRTMLDSVLPYVDASYILVDDRTTDNTREILDEYGVNHIDGKFENFAKFKNMLFAWIKDQEPGNNYWGFGLAPDETIVGDFGIRLRSMVADLDSTDVDGVRIPRRHWHDLEMKKEAVEKNWYPDHQMRLLRLSRYPELHSTRYVHEVIVGVRKVVQVENMDTHHFNLYWKPKIDYNWHEMNMLYTALQKKQQEDGGWDIWPD